MSVFLTPDLKPFYGGTYFPPFGGGGFIGFYQLLTRIAEIWKTTPQEIVMSAEEITRHLRSTVTSLVSDETRLTAGLRENAVTDLEAAYDGVWGGWGGAPKFPSPASISLLLREYQRKGNPHLLKMAEHTLTRMALGGIYDHLGGGFHRYSVDEKWLVPHFEKMLYDNAQLACAYLEAWQISGNDFYRSVACDTLQYLLREMRGTHGGFFSSEDADSGGEEGKYYLWTREEIFRCLGPDDGNAFCEAHNVQEEGNFTPSESYQQGKNILYRSDPNSSLPSETGRDFSALRNRLLAERRSRPRPGLDDKVITAWNALTITAFAKASLTWGVPEFEEAACKAGLFLRKELFKEGILHRTWRLGAARFPGYLDDYAYTANAFIDLYERTGDHSWLSTARILAELMVDRFSDKESGGFYSSATSHAHLLMRVKPFHDTSEPSPNAVAAMALARLGRFFDLPEFTGLARKALLSCVPLASRAPLGYLASLLAVDYVIEPPVDVVFAGSRDRNDTQRLVQVLGTTLLPCRWIAWSQSGEHSPKIPLCTDKPMQDAQATVYVCVNNTCLPPVTAPEDFAGLLRDLQG